LAVCCIGVVAVLALASGDLGSQIGLGNSQVKYEVLNEGRTEEPNRLRWEVDIVFQEDASAKQAVETAAGIIRDRLKTKPDLKAVVVLAYDTRGAYNLRQPHVLAMASSDGRGWA